MYKRQLTLKRDKVAGVGSYAATDSGLTLKRGDDAGAGSYAATDSGGRGSLTLKRGDDEGAGSYAEWLDVPWESGAITAIARGSDGRAVARAERHTNGRPAALRLSIDAPSPVTGTGDALLLDGQDAALLRASVVDDAGRVVHLASHNLSFRVLDGPGVVQGTHNGDPHSHISNDSPWHMAYHLSLIHI